MATLNETNGPSNALAGTMPALVEDRDGRKHWLVFDCTSIYAVHTSSSDLARALVLDRFGYGTRPELAERLDARPATQGEITAVCQRKRIKPLQVTPRNATRIGRIARVIYVNDLRFAGERSDEGSAAKASSGPVVRKAASRVHSRQSAEQHAQSPSERMQSR